MEIIQTQIMTEGLVANARPFIYSKKSSEASLDFFIYAKTYCQVIKDW